jgi:hypothetical protein
MIAPALEATQGIQITCEVPHSPWWHLSVGICIGVAACVGIIVPFFRDPKEIALKERVLWTALIVGLTIIELRMIVWNDLDADEKREYAQCLQLKQFQTILADNQQKFAATMSEVGGVFDKTKTAADTATRAVTEITGGSNFAYITPSSKFTHGTGFSVNIVNDGDTALTGVTVRFNRVVNLCPFNPPDLSCVPLFSGTSDMQPIFMGTIGPHTWAVMPNLVSPDTSILNNGEDRYDIRINAQNGTVYEDLDFRRAQNNNKGWAFRYLVHRALYSKASGLHDKVKVLKIQEWTEPSPLPHPQ